MTMPLSDTTRESGEPTTKADSARIDSPHEAYERMRLRWEKCRDLMEGTEAIRRNAAEYLPQLEGESDEAWSARVKLGALFNGFERTVLASVGMLSVNEPVLGADMPPELVELWEDVDGAGMHGAVFASSLVQHAIIDGHAGVFVDMPENTTGQQLDGDQAKRLGMQPYWILVTADDEWLPYFEVINGKKCLSLLIRRVRTSERFGTYGIRPLLQYWLYERLPSGVVEYEMYEVHLGGVPTLNPNFAAGRKVMRGVTGIPYARLVAGQELSDIESKPPLTTLADLNIEHHQTKNGILSLEELAFVPTQVRIGAMPDENGKYPEITLGPRNTIEAPIMSGIQKPVYWHQPDVSVIEPAMRTLEKTELAMEVSGSAFLSSQTRAQETAAAKKINARSQHATLARVARALQDCLECAFEFSGQFLNVDAGSVEVARDFDDTTLDPQAMVAYVQAVANAGLPPRILLEAWQKGGRIAADANLDDLETEMLTGQDAAAAARAMDAALTNNTTPPGAPSVDPAADPSVDPTGAAA